MNGQSPGSFVFGLSNLSGAAFVVAAALVLAAVALRNLICIAQLLGAIWVFKRRPPIATKPTELWQRTAEMAPRVAVIAAAYNEELSITSSVRSLLSLLYPDFELIVVNDGSPDRTIGVLIQEFGLVASERQPTASLHRTAIKAVYTSPDHPNLVVIDKANGRKADAVNAGISYANAELVCVIDADSVIDPEGLLRAVEPFRFDDGSLLAVGGSIRVANGCSVLEGHVEAIGVARSWLPRFQALEYFRAFLCARVTNARFGVMLLISGAFGVFRRDVLVGIGGYKHDTVGEDLEVLVRMLRRSREAGTRGRAEFLPEVCCWTEVPETLAGLRNQRTRWQQGAIETLAFHKRMLFNPRYGRLGMVAMPMLLLEDLVGPLLELAGYILMPLGYALGFLSLEFTLLFFGLTIVTGTILSAGGLLVEEWQLRPTPGARNLLRLIAAAVLENFGYRQAIQIFRLRGIYHYLRGNTAWAAVPRTGFSATN